MSIKTLFARADEGLSARVEKGMASFFQAKDEVLAFEQETLIEQLSGLHLPKQAMSTQAYMDKLEQSILPVASHLISPTYLGHMTSPLPSFIPEIGRLVQTLNQNMVKLETSRGLSLLEKHLLGLMHRQFYANDESFYEACRADFSKTVGVFTSGGTMANITALWAAVHHARQVYPQAKKYAVIGSSLMHYSFDKAAALLGVELIKVGVNEKQCLLPDGVQHAIDTYQKTGGVVAAVVAVAGTTDFGSIDPLAEIACIAHQHHIHMHVDAAWGGAFIMSSDKAVLLSGIEHADTITLDGHKQMLMPIGTGMLFFKNPALSRAIMHTAPYAVRATSLDQGRFTIEGTRPANMLYLHACLHLLGLDGYDELFTIAMKNIQTMAAYIQKDPAFELLFTPTMNILAYRYIPPQFRGKVLSIKDNQSINLFNQTLQKAQRARGKSFVSRSLRPFAQYEGLPLVFLRVVMLNPLVTETHLRFVLEDQKNIAQGLRVD